MGERLEALREPPRGLGFLERCDEIRQSAVVDGRPRWAAVIARLMARCVLPTAGAPRARHSPPIDEAELVETLDLVALERRVGVEVEVGERFHGRP